MTHFLSGYSIASFRLGYCVSCAVCYIPAILDVGQHVTALLDVLQERVYGETD